MTAIQRIDVSITTGDNGTDGPVYLGIARREFNLNKGGRNDFRRNSTSRFVLGGRNNVENVKDPELNDPAALLKLQVEDVDAFPRYIRYDGGGDWRVTAVTVTINPDSDERVLQMRGINLMLGPGTGRFLFL